MDRLEALYHLVDLEELEAQYTLEESLQDRELLPAHDTSRWTRRVLHRLFYYFLT